MQTLERREEQFVDAIRRFQASDQGPKAFFDLLFNTSVAFKMGIGFGASRIEELISEALNQKLK